MYAERSTSHWLSGPISFTLHAILIVLAVGATTATPAPTRRLLATIAWPVLVATPCCANPEHTGSGAETGGDIVAAPTTDRFDPGEVPTTIGVGSSSHLAISIRPQTGARPGDDVHIASMVSAEAGLEAPALRHMGQPRYPVDPSLTLAGQVDSVLVEYVVGVGGGVAADGIRIVSASGEEFARSVRQTLSRAQFDPARHDGAPVPALVRQLFRFVRGSTTGLP